MKNDDTISYVGTLQELGRPYSMLFVDKANRQLYIVVRISEDSDNSFMAADVSPLEVEEYMNENLGLIKILKAKSYRLATVNDGRIYFGKKRFESFVPTARMKRMDMFNPELCDDDVWLEVFLKRISNNQPLEIA